MTLYQRGLPYWRDWLSLGRISNLPTVWSNVLAGTLLAGGQPGWGLAGVLPAASLLYEAGMLLNDYCDRRIDARLRPERPIPAGRIPARTVLAVGSGMLLAGLSLLALQGWPALLAGLALAAAIVGYDLHHKGVAWSPWLMGGCRALLYAVAGFAAVAAPEARLAWAAAALLAYVAGLSYAAKQENLACFRAGWPLALLAAPLAYAAAHASLAALPYLALLLAWQGRCLWLLQRRRDIRRAVEGFIAGIALLDALFIATTTAPAFAPAALAAFALCHFWQRRVAGT